MTNVLRCLLAFTRYPRYLDDLLVRAYLTRWLRHRGVVVGSGVVWYGRPVITRHADSVISIGDACRICSRSSSTALGVTHPVIIRTLAATAIVRIGAGVRMSGTALCACQRIQIGDHCVIGSGVTIVDTDFHSLDPALRDSSSDAASAARAPIEIGNNVFIGAGSYVLKGVVIGDAAVIGAGSVVTHRVASRSIVAGNPARIVGTVDDDRPPGISSSGK